MERVRNIEMKTKHGMHEAGQYLMLALNSQPVPRKIWCFMYPKISKFHRAFLFEIFKLRMDLKFIYSNFQGNRFIKELAQAL